MSRPERVLLKDGVTALVVHRPDGEPTGEDFTLALELGCERVLVRPRADWYLEQMLPTEPVL